MQQQLLQQRRDVVSQKIVSKDNTLGNDVYLEFVYLLGWSYLSLLLEGYALIAALMEASKQAIL